MKATTTTGTAEKESTTTQATTTATTNNRASTAAAPVMSWRAASEFNPAKIGLHPPQAILRLDGQTLEFGETVVTGAQRYVRVGQRIALVPARFSPRPPTSTVRQAGQ